jgi:hypothetical protein
MNFRFARQDQDGKPANDLAPRMEMAGLAEFVSNDLSVFAHVKFLRSFAAIGVRGVSPAGATYRRKTGIRRRKMH